MPIWAIVMLIIIAVLVAGIIVLYILGKRAEKKKAEQDELIKNSAQPISFLVIDKKMMRLKDSGLPQQAIDQAGRFSRNAKLPIVKVKAGPKVMNLIADPEIFDQIPVKKEVKAMVSGLYITSVRGLHGRAEAPVQEKKGLRAKLAALRKKATS